MSSHLPHGFAERIRIIKSILDDVFPKSVDDWVNGFERDSNPEKELLIWECIALTFSTFMESRKLSADAKKEAIGTLLQCSMGMPEAAVLTKRKNLRGSDIRDLFVIYRASAEAMLAVDKSRQMSA